MSTGPRPLLSHSRPRHAVIFKPDAGIARFQRQQGQPCLACRPAHRRTCRCARLRRWQYRFGARCLFGARCHFGACPSAAAFLGITRRVLVRRAAALRERCTPRECAQGAGCTWMHRPFQKERSLSAPVSMGRRAGVTTIFEGDYARRGVSDASAVSPAARRGGCASAPEVVRNGWPSLEEAAPLPGPDTGGPGGVPLPEKHVHHARPDPFRNSWAAPHLRPQYAAAPRPAPARPWAGLLLDILAGG